MTRFARLMLTAAVLLPTAALAADAHKPQFGGVVVETKAADLEFVAKPDSLTVHFSDHGKPMTVTSATGKATVYKRGSH